MSAKMIKPYSPTLHTPRLILTMDTPDDLPFRHKLFLDYFKPGDPERQKWTIDIIAQFLAIGRANHLKSAPDGPPQAAYIVRFKPTPEYPSGEPIGGIIYFRRGEGTVPAEVGFGFLRKYQRMGYGVEAIGEVVRHVRECGVEEIYACTMKDNIGCQKTLKKIGFVDGGWVQMKITEGKTDRLVAFVLPGMKELEGQMLTWVGSTVDFGDGKKGDEKEEEKKKDNVE